MWSELNMPLGLSLIFQVWHIQNSTLAANRHIFKFWENAKQNVSACLHLLNKGRSNFAEPLYIPRSPQTPWWSRLDLFRRDGCMMETSIVALSFLFEFYLKIIIVKYNWNSHYPSAGGRSGLCLASSIMARFWRGVTPYLYTYGWWCNQRLKTGVL